MFSFIMDMNFDKSMILTRKKTTFPFPNGKNEKRHLAKTIEEEKNVLPKT